MVMTHPVGSQSPKSILVAVGEVRDRGVVILATMIICLVMVLLLLWVHWRSLHLPLPWFRPLLRCLVLVLTMVHGHVLLFLVAVVPLVVAGIVVLVVLVVILLLRLMVAEG